MKHDRGRRASLKDNTLGIPIPSLNLPHSHHVEMKHFECVYKTTRFYPGTAESSPYTEEIQSASRQTLPIPRSYSNRGHTSHGREARRGSIYGIKEESAHPRSSSPIFERERAASIAASAGGQDPKRPRFTIWAEWNDADVNAEKWEVAHKGKDDKKGKSPTVAQHFFDDPEGKVEMPSSLKVDHWKRPYDFIVDKAPVIVADDHTTSFDLISSNEHLHDSELVRFIISQITALWEMSLVKTDPEIIDPSQPIDEVFHSWKPWEHIYSLCKAGRGPHLPLYNSHGKYIVRLYWMGCWRKIYVDDLLPFDENDQLLLPATMLQHELWPMLLTKALIKVASLDYTGGNNSSEFGDFNVIQTLTGWIPETIPLKPNHIKEVWNLLHDNLPDWKLPDLTLSDQPAVETDDASKKDTQNQLETPKDEKTDKDTAKDGKSEKTEKGGKEKGKEGKDKDKGKDGKEDKKKDKGDKGDKDKDKNRDKHDETPLPEKPEIVFFASYTSTPKYPVKVSVLGEMADVSEKLRQTGLSHIYPHPVWITQTRSCPLEPPPVPEVIPAWKLIRPRKKKEIPSDEPKEAPEPPKPIQCLELTSPFVNYKVSPVPIPTETLRPKSSLSRGATRSRPETAVSVSIEEIDENAPDPEILAIEKKDEALLSPCPVEEEKEIEIKIEKAGSPVATKEKKGKASAKKEGGKESPKPDRKTSRSSIGSPVKAERTKSAAPRSDSRQSKRDVPLDDSKSKESKEKLKSEKTGAVSSEGGLSGVEATSSLTNMDTEDVTPTEGETNQVETHDDSRKPKKIWVDYEQFCKCFKTLYVYHKTNTYPKNYQYSDLKGVSTGSSSANKSEKKSTAPPVSSTPGGKDKSPDLKSSQSNIKDRSSSSTQRDKIKPDKLQTTPRVPSPISSQVPTEVVISFSVIPRWFDPPPPPPEEKRSHTSVKTAKDKELEKEPTAMTSSSVLDGGSVCHEKSAPPVLTPGSLIAEPYSWKSLVTGQPIMRLRTTATKAAVLSLPAGRHVLRFMMTAPLGYHVHLCSSVNFVFGDEENVMAQLTNESCRFRDTAYQVINNLGKCVQSFNDQSKFNDCWEKFVQSHCPYQNEKNISKQHHFEVFNEAFYAMLKRSLKEIATPEMAFAWRAFNFDCTTNNILGLSVGSRPATGTSTGHRGSAKPGKKRDLEKSENIWTNREATTDEQVATVKMQKVWRAHWVRKLAEARRTGTEENAKAYEQLQKSWSVIEQNMEENGLFLFRELFKRDSDLMKKYSFHQDEWNKISYSDYKGIYPDQPPNNWFLVFREIFYVKEEMLAVPKLYVPINTCLLRVINNDTGEELPKVFQKVAPYVYKKNKKGYTMVAEARTTDQSIMSGSWRMRLIGSLSPLPAPRGTDVNCSFSVKEIRDYYIPNSKHIILRYTVKVTEEHLASLQLNTSKTDVYIKLMVLDHEEEVASMTGKGHVVIPAFIFQKDHSSGQSAASSAPPPLADEDTKRAGSRASNKGMKGSSQQLNKSKRSSSAKSREEQPKDGRNSVSSQHSDSGDTELEEKDLRPHKYTIQAVVLHHSWPLSESSWQFVNMMKELEKNELKVAFKERAPSPPSKTEKAAPSSKGKQKGKGEKSSKDKETKTSRPPSQQFDFTKPFWTLRIVSDEKSAEEIEVKRDTERADEIRAMKKAWEDAEPGRAAKALQSRLKYLNSHMIKVEHGHGDGDVAADEVTEGGAPTPKEAERLTPVPYLDQADDTILTLEPPPPPQPTEILQPIDLTPFIKKTLEKPKFLDEEEMQRRMEARQKEIQEYKAARERVEQWREQDKINRNQTKIRQLEECEELQAALDAARNAVNKPREAFRQKYLEAERKRLEELAAQELSMKTELEAKSPKGRKSAKGQKSAGKKKK
ncbi:hypothetical protein LOTGIDRAFT_229226 [Lottia gigantea]|uniref:Uncharacterized protein n=1 Tax=Lottia gigantea TaxID=225164 RepID=V4A3A1_LOTGI|nr:hypothetical protein LOTGIDRAFT_229226 [Lottia gigantea]ESO89380.1 hypothetical protein LOTGIDRAFT_229226 [Lottia gigantea]